MMFDLTYFIAILIISLMGGQVIFVVLRYFILKRQGHYEDEIEKLNEQAKNNKLSESLFNQELLRLRQKYKPEFFERWWQKSK